MIINFPPIKWEFEQVTKIESFPVKLGDNYSVSGIVFNSDRVSCPLVFPGLNKQQTNALAELFESLEGSRVFQWRPDSTTAYKDYVCDNWEVIEFGENIFQITANLSEIR